MASYRFKPSINACERNRQITEARGFFKIPQTTKTALECDGEYLYFREGDLQGLTMAEIQSATPYTPEENI